MAGSASRENGKKGGRPVGSKATHTIELEAAKKELIRAYIENIKPINDALIKKAVEGDLAAIKELHDRVYGKAMQPVEGKLTGELKMIFDPTFRDAK